MGMSSPSPALKSQACTRERKPRARSVREHWFRTRGLLNHSHLEEVMRILEGFLGYTVVEAGELGWVPK